MMVGNSEALSAVFARFPVLETERFILRAPTPDDSARLFQILSNTDVTRHLGRLPMTSMDEAVKRIEMFRTNFESQQALLWAVVRRDQPDHLLGTCVFWNLIPAHYRAEIGYLLDSAWWGQGVMTEVVTAALDFGFSRMSLHSVAAQIDPANDRSRGLLEKLGFVQEAYFHEDFFHPVEQRFTDTAVFSLLESTWKARRA